MSAIPPSPADRQRTPDNLTLMAVNDTPIRTYGKRSLTLNLGLRRSLPWIFIIADVQKPILGADFLRHFGLLVDMQKRQLVDTHTHLHIQGILSSVPSPSPSICPKDTTNPYLTLLAEFPALTQVCSPDTPGKHDVTHHIETTGPPASARHRRLAPDRLRAAKQEFEHMLQLGIIRPSSSAWSSPLHMVPKKTPGDWRPWGTTALSTGVLFLIATRFPTSTTSPRPYKAPPFSPNLISCVPTIRFQSLPLISPRPPSQLHSDCLSSYACLSVSGTLLRHSSDLWIKFFVVFPQCMLTLTMSLSPVPLRNNTSRTYVFERLSSHGIVINPNKCLLGVKELDFLGHHIDQHGITPLPEKVQAVRDFSQPQIQRQLRQFIGLVNFYHHFLPHCANLMQPLHALLTASKPKSQPINDDALAAFNATKEALANASLLYYPAAAAPTCLVTDASNTAVGAVLQQYVNGTWHPISFFSRKMTPAETRYSTFDRELLAVYLAIKHFRHFLEGRHFHVLTEHKPHICTQHPIRSSLASTSSSA